MEEGRLSVKVKFLLVSLIVFVFMPFCLMAKKGGCVEEGDVIIYRSGPSEHDVELNRLRSFAKEEHSWEMLKSFTIGIRFTIPREPFRDKVQR